MIDSYNYNSIDDNILFNGGTGKLLKSAKKKFATVRNEIYNDTAKLSKQAKSKRDNIKKAFIEDTKNIQDSFTSLRSSDIVNANIALTDTLYDMSKNEHIKQFIIKNNGNVDNNLYKNLLTQIYQYKNKSLSFIKIIFYSKFNWVLKQYLLNVNNDKNIKSLINKLINKEELIKQINYLYNRKISKQDELNILYNLQKILSIINILISAKFTVKKKKLTMSKNSEEIYTIISDKFNNNNNIRLNINHINLFEDNIQLISDILKEELPSVFDSNTYSIENNKIHIFANTIDNNKIHIFANRFFNVKQDSKLKAIINELKTRVKPDDIKKLTEIVTIDNNIFNYKLYLKNNNIESLGEINSNREQLEKPIKFIKLTVLEIDQNFDFNQVKQIIIKYFKALNIENFNEHDLLPKNYQDNNVLKHLVLNKILIFLTIIIFVSQYDNYDDFYKNLLNYTRTQSQVGGGVSDILLINIYTLFDSIKKCIISQFKTTNGNVSENNEEREIIKITANGCSINKVSLPNNSELPSNNLSSKRENLINEYFKIQFINIINNPAYLGILQTDDNGNDKEYKINTKDIQELYKDFHIGNDKNISQDTLLKNFTLGLDSNKLKKIDNIIDEKLTDDYLNFSIFKGIFDIPKERRHKKDKIIEEQSEKQPENQQEKQLDISNIFTDDISFIFNKLSKISNKSLKLDIRHNNISNINTYYINTYKVDTFESIDSLFINIYNRLNYLNSKKIYIEINDILDNITTTPVKFIEPFILNDIKIKQFTPPTPPRDITIPNIQMEYDLGNIITTPVEFIERLIINDIKIKPFSPPKQPRDITIPNIQIDNNLYNITTTPVKFIEPLSVNGITVIPISDKRPQPHKQKAIEESIEAKDEIESILEKDKAGNILPEQKKQYKETIQEKLKKVRFDELDVIMEKCKQDDYKNTDICEFIYGESSRHIQQKNIANMLSLSKDSKDSEDSEDSD
tara:strand:- start:4537 stop:7443 length:2907 start_codon:yes stop_codon:yes gene_type:complete